MCVCVVFFSHFFSSDTAHKLAHSIVVILYIVHPKYKVMYCIHDLHVKFENKPPLKKLYICTLFTTYLRKVIRRRNHLHDDYKNIYPTNRKATFVKTMYILNNIFV